jgi:hypothetical protein
MFCSSVENPQKFFSLGIVSENFGFGCFNEISTRNFINVDEGLKLYLIFMSTFENPSLTN